MDSDRAAKRALKAGIAELENAANGDQKAWAAATGWFAMASWRLAAVEQQQKRS